MVEIDRTLEDLRILYQAVGGNENYEIWDETWKEQGKIQKSLQKVARALEEEKGHEEVSTQRIVDYWPNLQKIGILDENWEETELGLNWVKRVEGTVQSLYMTGADIAGGRENLGDIFYTLGSPNVLPALHVFHENGDLSEHMEPHETREPVQTMYNHGFIQEEAYKRGDWRPENSILTERAETVYEEVVEADYRWLKE